MKKKFCSGEFGEWDYIQELSKNPSNQEMYDKYKNWLETSTKEDRERKDYHRPTYFDKLKKLAFLKAQDENNVVEMQKVAKDCNPNWLAIVSRPEILNCGRPDPEDDKNYEQWWKSSQDSHREETLAEWRENHPHFKMNFVCTKKWNEMKPTENRKVRFCGDCKKNVYFCEDIVEARELGDQGCCIGLDVGIKRSKEERVSDLVGELSIFGTPKADTIENEKTRILPDRVSAKRIMKRVELKMRGKSPPPPAEYSHDYGD
jgi:hypothetical protein